MKRGKYLLLGLILVMTILVTGCSKKAITAADFKTIMEERGYSIIDATSQFSGYGYVKSAYIALGTDEEFQIEFYEMSSVDKAVSFYNNNKAIFESSKSSAAVESTVNMGNHSKYTLTTNGSYKIVSRIENTVVYLDVAEDKKDIVKDILEALGY